MICPGVSEANSARCIVVVVASVFSLSSILFFTCTEISPVVMGRGQSIAEPSWFFAADAEVHRLLF